MKNAKRFSVIIGLVIAIVVLSLPIGARADYTYSGTNRDDTIYFGYCDTCHNGGPGLLICRETEGTPSHESVAMDNGILVIRGRNGDDYINAVCGEDKGGCRFGNWVTMATTASLALSGTRVCMEVRMTTISWAMQAMINFMVVLGMTICVATKGTTGCAAGMVTIFSWEVQVTITLMAALAGIRSAAAAMLL
jgi:hypothetical protein